MLGFSLALMGFCPLFVGIFLFCRAPLSALVVGMAWATLLLNLLALRRSGAVRGSALTVAVTAWLTYTSLAFLQGGHDSPGLMWYATLPIISVALLGPRAGWWGWLLGAAIVTGFYLASLNRIAIPCELSDAGLLFVEYTGLLGLMLCTLALTATFNAMEAAAQRRIGEALDQAMVADRTKSEFLANMSHEIRTPLNAMLGFAELLLEGAVEPDETPDALRTIKRNGEHLLTIISDILDLSKIESGQMTLEPLPCDPVGVIRDVLQLVRSRAEPKGLTLTLRTEGVVPRQIVTDPTRLKQILLNLVGNAIKFTERGGVTVALRGADGRLQISVIDTGIGLTEDQQNRLFKAFSQGDTSTTRRFGGTGLGLVISRRLAEMLGGDIAVQSDVGSGATFTISMPNTVVVEPEAASLANNSTAASRYALPVLSGRRILIADDMPDNRRLISFLLAKTGAECVAVDDGATAIAAVMMAVIDGRPFDLILMDMQMPVLDGYAATQQLRAEGCRLPIVALTANSMSTDRERCLAAGCDDYLSKPIQREQMYGLIARWIATPAEASVTVS
ncbi:MAG TPA: ATP-binding protein [Planctomycetaceae bacterium]|nr:ATP-binding protein [Planctomycetaceae bacterium]